MEGHPIVRGLWMKIKVQAVQGVPLTRIAAGHGIDRKTARKLRDAAAEPTVSLRRRPSRLEPYAEWIRERLAAGVPAAQLVRDLARRGVVVPYPTLRDFAGKLRPEKEAPAEEVRFETPPAKQAQCDWADCGRMLERERIVYALPVRDGAGLFAQDLREVYQLDGRADAAALSR